MKQLQLQEIEHDQHELLLASLDKFIGGSRNNLKEKKYRPVRVKYKGKLITTASNKTVWKSLGAAKNAVRNWLHSYLYDFMYYKLKIHYPQVNELIKKLEDAGIIEYVYLEETVEYSTGKK